MSNLQIKNLEGSNDERSAELFRLTGNPDLYSRIYSKVYEHLGNYHDPININNNIYNSYDPVFGKGNKILPSVKYFGGRALGNNFPVYFLSSDFCKKALDAEIDKNILFEDLTLPYDSFFYMIPKDINISGKGIQWINLCYSSDESDIMCTFMTADNMMHKHMVRDSLTSSKPLDIDTDQTLSDEDKQDFRNLGNTMYNFIAATILFHQTGGFEKTFKKATPLPMANTRNGTFPVKRSRASANIIKAPAISYEKSNSDEPPKKFEGYYQARPHIRIRKNKDGSINIISVSSKEINPNARPEHVNFDKRKMSDEEVNNYVRTNKNFIVDRLKSKGYSDEEITQYLKKNNITESFRSYIKHKLLLR